jgi:hypothetical protein
MRPRRRRGRERYPVGLSFQSPAGIRGGCGVRATEGSPAAPAPPLPAFRYSLPSPISNNVSIADIARAGNSREGLASWLPRCERRRSLAPVQTPARALVCGSARAHAGTGDPPCRRPGNRPGVPRIRCAARSATVVSVPTCRRNCRLPGRGLGRRVAVKGRMSNVADYRRQGTLVSDRAFQASWNLAVTASATAAVACTGAAAPS